MMRTSRPKQTDRAGIDLRGFNYDAAAELFAGQNKNARSPVTYNRFDSAAEALRFAMEQAPTQAMIGACLEVDEIRYGFDQIRILYGSAAYPLQRRS